MATSDDDPLHVIMATLRSRLEGRTRAAADVAALAARYSAAVKADAEAELARRQGHDTPPPDPSPAELAARLFEIVGSLPELRDEPPEDEAPPVAAREAISFGDLIAGSELQPTTTPKPTAPARTDPNVLDLVDDLHSYELLKLPAPLFRAVVEELAARGRELQDRGVSDPDDSLSYLFRVLTRCAYDRKIPNLLGLDHRHQANWRERAEHAREQRLKLEASPPKPKPAAVPKHEDDPEDHSEPAERWTLPHLAARASTLPVVLIGGVKKPEKLERLRDHLGFDLEWIGTTTSGMGSTGALERRIREGHVAAVVIVEGLISHKHSEQIVAAARTAHVPLAYGGTAGTGALKKAFEQIEAALRARG